MRILDLFRPKAYGASRQFELDLRHPEAWAQETVAHLGIDKSFAQFKERVEGLRKQATGSLIKFTDENILAAIPDRARTMNALHGQEYATQVRKLLATCEFGDLFSLEKEQDAYFEASSAFKDLTSKNVAVLKEFMADELKATQAILQQLEDIVINFLKTLEERKFPHVRKLRDIEQRCAQVSQRGERYQKLLESLQTDLKRTQEKRTRLDNDIKVQEELIRNESALEAVRKSNRIEEELHNTAVKYASLCDDLHNLYKKHPDIKPSPALKHVIDELPKDPLRFVSDENERSKAVFEETVTQLEEANPGNVKGVIERLTRCARDIEADARRIQTSLPDQKLLKREIMKDIAALNIYDKLQFLLRARTEEETLQRKIEYLHAELDPAKLAAMRQEMKAIAHELGARFRDEPEPAKENDEEGTKEEEGEDAKNDQRKGERPSKKTNKEQKDEDTGGEEPDGAGDDKQEEKTEEKLKRKN